MVGENSSPEVYDENRDESGVDKRDIPGTRFLRATKLFRQPVREIVGIHRQAHSWQDQRLTKEGNLLEGIRGDVSDIRTEIEFGNAAQVGFTIRGEKIQYNVSEAMLSCVEKSASLSSIDNRITLQILVGRTSIEVFGNDGRVSMCSCFLSDLENTIIAMYASGEEAEIISPDVYELRSAWL